MYVLQLSIHECLHSDTVFAAATDPSWASINLGVLICKHCAGVHRNLGVQVCLSANCELCLSPALSPGCFQLALTEG